MNAQERQLIDELFDRLSKLESAPRDADAEAAIMQGLRRAPNAAYALVQTALVQDEALKRANARIEELEGRGSAQTPGGFLDTMRDALFGAQSQHGSVPNVPGPGARPQEPRPIWNSGQVNSQLNAQVDPRYGGNPGYAAPYGAPFTQGGSGGSFLGTAAATAAGVIGGAMLMNSIRGLMGGGSHQAFADSSGFGSSNAGPWRDQSDSSLAHDAGIDDISRGGERHADDGGSRQGLFDQASNDDDDDDGYDADDVSGNDFGGGDSDVA